MVELASIKIKKSEYQKRLSKLLDFLKLNQLTGVVLFERDYLLYYTGFAFIPTERPIAFLMNDEGHTSLLLFPDWKKSMRKTWRLLTRLLII